MLGIWCHGLILSISGVMCWPSMMFIISMSPQPRVLHNITAGITLPLMGMPRTLTDPVASAMSLCCVVGGQ
jgi:hypothetical protein